MLQVSWSIGGRCLSKLFKDFYPFLCSIYSFQNLQWKAKLQVNPICSLQLNWREPLISHNDLPMAGGRANHLEPINGLPWWRRGTDLIRTLWVTRRTGGDFIHFPFLLQEISPHFYFQVLVSRRMIWAGWHHMAGVPQWVTAWAFVALFVAIVSVFIKCGKEDFNLWVFRTIV